MFFLNLHREKQNKQFSLIAKIALVILLFCVISDKSGAFNVSQNVTKFQTMNMDFIANELMMLGKLSFNYSFFIALGLVGILVATLFTITCCALSVSKESKNNDSVKEYSYTVESAKNLHTNNIYLLNNQFIC